jgi:flagellar basal body rod protein FlgG
MGISIRPTGIDHAAAALRNLERRQEIVANNLANVSTDGFKGERAFARLLGDGGTPAVETATDLRPGALSQTNQPLDVAIAKNGFFVVETAAGERLTRGGSLSLDGDRRLVDASGHAVLDDGGGPITLPPNAKQISIDATGSITADGRAVGRLRVEDVEPGTRLQHDVDGLFLPSAVRRPLANEERTVRQGVREESNVQSVTSLVDMISIQRAYASAQKVITTIDSARGIAVSEIGKPV